MYHSKTDATAHNSTALPPFLRQGMASLDDLLTSEWKEFFCWLEAVQTEFLAAHPHSPGYKWPKDALHTATRVWEYPFIYAHLRARYNNTVSPRPLVIDLGSGATFFPFAVARLGCDVLAIDLDPESRRSLEAAKKRLQIEPGTLRFKQSDICDTGLEEGCADCIYSVSVLEHLPTPSRAVPEVARLLAPQGLFILTYDLDLNGTCAIGPREHRRLRDAIDEHFESVHPDQFVHPMRMLTTDNSPYPYYGTRFAKRKAQMRGLLSRVLGRSGRGAILASTFGQCLRRRTQ